MDPTYEEPSPEQILIAEIHEAIRKSHNNPAYAVPAIADLLLKHDPVEHSNRRERYRHARNLLTWFNLVRQLKPSEYPIIRRAVEVAVKRKKIKAVPGGKVSDRKYGKK